MKKLLLLSLLALPLVALADTPAPGTVKAKTYSGDGNTAITATGSALNVNVTNFSGGQTVNQGTAGLDPWFVSVRNSALPTNACQETGGNLAAILSALQSPLAVTGTFWQATQPVSAASLPLPSGASTAANQSTANASLATIATNTGNIPPGLTVASSALQVVQPDVVATASITSSQCATLSVNGLSSAGIQITGTWTGFISFSASVDGTNFTATGALTLSSGAIVGAVTGNGVWTIQTTGMSAIRACGSSVATGTAVVTIRGNQGTSSVMLDNPIPTGTNTIGNIGQINSALPSGTNLIGKVGIDQTTPGTTNGVQVNAALPAGTNVIGHVIVDSVPTTTVTGTVTANAGTGTFTVDGSGHTQPISAASLPLPSGASTAAKQPALGTAGSPSSDIITVQGVTSMTALKVDGSAVTQPVSGTVTANAGTGTFTVDASGHTVPVSGTFWQATQPVSGTVTANLGTVAGLALNTTVAGLQVAQGSTTSGQSGSLSLGAVTTSGPTYTTGQSSPFSLTTAGALRIDGSAVTQPVSGTFWQATQPVSLSTLPALTAGSAIVGKVGIDQTTPGTTNGVQVNAALPAGTNVIGKVSIDQTTPGTTNLVALAANQSVNVAQINGTTPLMGNGTTGTGSQRVTIASDNTAFTVNAAPKTPAALTVKQAALTVGTSAVRLTNDAGAPPSTRVLLVAQLLSTSTANCFFGSSGVTTTSTTRGVQMFPGQTLSFTLDAGDYYAICDASSQTIFVTEQE